MHQIAMGSSERRAPSPASGTAVARGNSGSNQEGSNSVPARTSASAIQEAQENEKEMLKRVQELTAKVDQVDGLHNFWWLCARVPRLCPRHWCSDVLIS